jgi:hypothetical protein
MVESIATQIIKAFGGLRPTARALGHKNVSTVQGWAERGSIPSWRHHEIRIAAERKEIALPAAFSRSTVDESA